MMNHTAPVAILPPPPPEVVGNESVNESQQQQQQQHMALSSAASSIMYTDGMISSTSGTNTGNSGVLDSLSFGGGGGGGANSTTSHASHNTTTTVATLSSPWQYDDYNPTCHACHAEFTPLNRRHHCRLCGKIFCHACSSRKALIPPSSIVLVPSGGKKCKPRSLATSIEDGISSSGISFTPEEDPDRMLTYLSGGGGGSSNSNYNTNSNELLYGKGLEERFKLAREPLRVCGPCHHQLAPLQDDLRNSNSNAMRFNHVDPTDARRLFNSPVAHTLGHEIRKAAYTLNNLLPLPKRLGATMTMLSSSSSGMHGSNFNHNPLAQSCAQEDSVHCKESCSALSPNLGALDGVRIPARLLEQARGIAILTVIKGGFGLAGAEFGTGLVVARTDHWLNQNNRHQGQQQQQQQRTWSAPSAIGTCGLSWGALVGAQVSDHVFLLMTDDAVQMLFSDTGSVQLGADVGVALGPLGRAVEGNVGAAAGTGAAHVAPIYTYSLSKGFYAGISLDGKVIRTRHAVNERFYGRQVSAREILNAEIPLPPAAQPLYEALARCHVYAASQSQSSGSSSGLRQAQQEQLRLLGGGRNQQQQQQQHYFQQAQQQPFGSYPHIQPTLSAAPPLMMMQQQQQQQQLPKLFDPAIVEQEDSGLVGEYGEMPNQHYSGNAPPTTATTTTPTMVTLPPVYAGDAHSAAATITSGMSEMTLDPA